MPLFLLVVGVGVLAAAGARAAAARRDRELAITNAFRTAVHRAAAHLGFRAPPALEDRVHTANGRSDGRAVYVNPAWLLGQLEAHCVDGRCGAAIVTWIAVHELAHHVCGDALVLSELPYRRFMELRSDFLAGWVLGRDGHDVASVERLMRDVARVCGTHPRHEARIIAVRAGAGLSHLPWNAALIARARQLHATALFCPVN